VTICREVTRALANLWQEYMVDRTLHGTTLVQRLASTLLDTVLIFRNCSFLGTDHTWHFTRYVFMILSTSLFAYDCHSKPCRRTLELPSMSFHLVQHAIATPKLRCLGATRTGTGLQRHQTERVSCRVACQVRLRKLSCRMERTPLRTHCTHTGSIKYQWMTSTTNR
jgi:hypothetical protein